MLHPQPKGTSKIAAKRTADGCGFVLTRPLIAFAEDPGSETLEKGQTE